MGKWTAAELDGIADSYVEPTFTLTQDYFYDLCYQEAINGHYGIMFVITSDDISSIDLTNLQTEMENDGFTFTYSETIEEPIGSGFYTYYIEVTWDIV